MKQNLLKRGIAMFGAAVILSSGASGMKQNSSALHAHAATPLPTAISDFSLADVTMTDAYCANAFAQEVKYLLSFQNDKLLAGFRENAGLSTNGATRYDGWENSLIGGHSVGHYLTAIAQAYQNPSITSTQRDQLFGKMKALIDGMLECQAHSRGKANFLWAAKIIDNNNVEAQFNNVENGQTNIITQAWVPWYTMHKLVAGIVDVYNKTGYENAKKLGSNLGDWVYQRVGSWNASLQAKVLSVEYGGMNDCMYALYQITGNPNHAAAAHIFDETALFEKVLTGGSNVLNGRHANTTIPKFIGALQRYQTLNGKQLNGQTVDATRYLEYAEAFWQNVTSHHSYLTGGNSEWEHFGMDDILDKERTNCNCETCNSYNMLKLSRELFKITGDKQYIDFYERTYYNSILSSQNPESGMTTYFQPMATGYFKVYSSPFNHFWCCTGSGMESFSKLGDTIYQHEGNTLYVNLYQSSKLNWAKQNVTITQTSTIPDGDTATFTISGKAELDLRFRVPYWKAGNITLRINGEAYRYVTENGYIQVKRSFEDGDEISLTIPQEVVAYSLPDSAQVYGFQYGPVVLSAELGTANLKQSTTGMNVSIPADKVVNSEKINISGSNGSVATFMMNINDYMKKDANSLKFILTGTNTNLTFSPHYRQYQQRYGIYWYFYSPDAPSEEDIPRSKTTVVDTIQPGYGQYENDELHAMQETQTVSVTDDSTYRYAEKGGSFTYRMAIDSSAPYSILKVTFRKSDNGKQIQIQVGNTVLYAKTLDYTGDASVYDVSIIIPPALIEQTIETVSANDTTYDVVPIRFAGIDGSASAKVCDFIYMQAVKPLYNVDNSLAYFVDCGDHNTSTVTGSDAFGYYNSLTEQIYGVDRVTGATWGLIDDPTDQYNGASKSKALYTANTWANEANTSDGLSKTSSFRYTKNQYENDIARHLDYGFTLPNGRYSVEIGFCDTWGCSNEPTIFANIDTENEQLLAEKLQLTTTPIMKAKVRVNDGKLTLNLRSESKAINVTYIAIAFDELDELPIIEPKQPMIGDVNCDNHIDVADAILLNRYISEDSDCSISAQGIVNANCNGDSLINSDDSLLILRYIAKLISSFPASAD